MRCEAAGRFGTRAFSEFAGEGCRGGSTLKQCGRPSPATLSRADPPQTAFREGEVGGVQREVSIFEAITFVRIAESLDDFRYRLSLRFINHFAFESPS